MTASDRTPSWKKLSLFAVTWPIFIDSVLRMLIGTVDVFMLSRISDTATGVVGQMVGAGEKKALVKPMSAGCEHCGVDAKTPLRESEGYMMLYI
ncbi:hypothetical protein COLU111180_16525 [Cohnella lubricantis]|nr:hypothetical protein [Cohnella lubricantis]